MTETVAATTNPTDASASADAAATLLAAANGNVTTQQQTQTVETPAAKTVATPAAETRTEQPAAAAVPEKYTFTAPEGTEYAPEVLESFEGAAKEAGLSQDAAQKLIEKMAPALIARQVDQVQAIHNEWREASSADKEFGGEKLQENLAVAKKALDLFDPTTLGADGKPVPTPLRSLLDETGLGNHPEILRFMFRAGKAISEDKFVAGATGRAGATTTAANILYDKTTKG